MGVGSEDIYHEMQNPLPIPKREDTSLQLNLCMNAKRGHVSRTGYPIDW